MTEKDYGYVEVAVDRPLYRTFCYGIPPHLHNRIAPGALVWVPFGNQQTVGFVIKLHNEPPEDMQIKDVIDFVEETPVFTEKDMAWYQWASQYYFCPVGQVLSTAVDPSLRTKTQQRVRASAFKKRKSPPGGMIEIVRLIPEEEDSVEGAERRSQRIGPKQKQILQMLSDSGEYPVNDLERAVPGAKKALPGLIKKGLIEIQERPEPAAKPNDEKRRFVTSPHRITPYQQLSLMPVRSAIEEGVFKAFLLWGVTGSGKTEIYLQATEACLRKGEQALILVPEISLTHQLVQDFRARFGERIAIVHSRLSGGERKEIWRSIFRSEVSIVLGARSALFAPCRNLGLVILDEEHESAYKQEDVFRYHARDMALMRGKMLDCPVLLGSATPSLESFNNTRTGKLTWLELPERIEGRPLPDIDIVDIRRKKGKKGVGLLSPELLEAIETNLAKKEQTLLFLNRRGFASFLLCTACGHVIQCPNCAVSLVWHKAAGFLRCHYCEWKQPAPEKCPQCAEGPLMDLGSGTETIEAEMLRRFPNARVLRMDRDTTTRKHAQRDILRTWKKGEADILIGTQMIAKGHHVPNVTLVGVVLSDVSLNLPDFRASERTFQLLLQVAGRAGRGDRPGRVIVQTYLPFHPCIRFAATQDYRSFAEHELPARAEAGYPPFQKLALIRISGLNEDRTIEAARTLGRLGNEICRNGSDVRLLGPAPAPLHRLKGRFRWQILLKSPSPARLHAVIRSILERYASEHSSSRVRITVDIDPQSFL